MKATRRYLVQGRVQGVGFRWFVQRQASALKLTGFVRNLDSGEVEAVASGSAEHLDKFRDQLRRGPLGSRVSDVLESEAPDESYRAFQITY